jgi:hypothetical protein
MRQSKNRSRVQLGTRTKDWGDDEFRPGPGHALKTDEVKMLISRVHVCAEEGNIKDTCRVFDLRNWVRAVVFH